nr:formin-like protein 3 [Taeniopygia guttata]
MAAPPSPPHRSRHPELRHSATRGCRLSSPHPTSLSAPAAPPAATPRSAGPLWRSPHDQRFGPSPCTHPPVGRPRPPPSSPRLKRLNIPAAAPPVPRTGAANGSAALPASPPRPAPLRILFSPYALGNAYGEKRDRGGTAVIPALIGIPTQHGGKQRGAAPFFLPPPTTTPRCHLAASPMSRRTHPPPTPPCRDSAPRTCRAAPPPPPTRRVLPGLRGKGRSVLPPRGKHRDAGVPPERNNRPGRHRAEGWNPLLEAAGSGAPPRPRRVSDAGRGRKTAPKKKKIQNNQNKNKRNKA